MLDPHSAQAAKRRFEYDVHEEGKTDVLSSNLHEVISILRRKGRLIAGIVIIGTFLAILVAFSLTRYYTSTVTLLVDPRQSNAVDLEGSVGGIGTDLAAIESEVELLKSRAVAERVVKKLDLENDPEFAPKTSVIGALKGAIGQLFSSDEMVEQPLDDSDVNPAIVSSVQKGFTANRKGLTYVLEAHYTSELPQKAARIANTFADEYLVDQLEAKFEATKRANEWLNDRVSELRERVRTAERAVEQFKSENNLVDTGGVSLNEQQVTQLNEQLILARAKAAESLARVQQIERVDSSGGSAAAFADALQSQVIASLRSKYAEIAREEAELSSKYGPRHPSVINVRAQLGDINRQIKEEIGRIVATSRNEYEVAKSRVASIETSLDELKQQFGQGNQAAVQLRELEREAQATRALFESFLGKFKETQQQESLQTADTRIIAKALVPSVPSHPRRSLIIAIGFVLSAGFAIGLAFLLEFLDSGIHTRERLEEVTGARQLATIPTVAELKSKSVRADWFTRFLRRLKPAKEKTSLEPRTPKQLAAARTMNRMVLDKPLSSYTESIRSLRMGIKFTSIDDPARIIMVTSALPGEGKSTTAANLAQYAANTGEKVLLIDADLRHPALTTALRSGSDRLATPSAGLIDLITGRVALADVTAVDEQSGLRFIAGRSDQKITHTAELLASERMKRFLASAREAFDLIVVDSSPLLPVVDSRALLDAVDGVVMVVAWERTERSAVKLAMREAAGIEDKLLGAVLNDMDMDAAKHYDYYASSAYMKKYPYYYQEG
jgi:exopolysaccharide transport family protein